jgi:hypothetical protein
MHHAPHEQLLVRLEACGVPSVVGVARHLLWVWRVIRRGCGGGGPPPLGPRHQHPQSTLRAVARRRGAGTGGRSA